MRGQMWGILGLVSGVVLLVGGTLLRLWDDRKPRCRIRHRGDFGLLGGGCIAVLGLLQWCSPQPWLVWVIGISAAVCGVSLLFPI